MIFAMLISVGYQNNLISLMIIYILIEYDEGRIIEGAIGNKISDLRMTRETKQM